MSFPHKHPSEGNAIELRDNALAILEKAHPFRFCELPANDMTIRF